MRTTIYTIFFLLFVLIIPTISVAQEISLPAIVGISLTPQNPQPNQIVTAVVSSSSVDINTSTIVWILDGVISQQKTGGREFSFVSGSLGSTQTLGVLVTPFSGKSFAKTLKIRPAQVTLVWEADTYIPPFYKGRPLYTLGSTIHAEALANFKSSDGIFYAPSDLVYTWSKNGIVLGSKSGVGASFLITEGPKFLGTDILSVKVSTKNATIVASSAVEIKTSNPVVQIYEKDPLVGVLYNRALGNRLALSSTNQFEIQAVPYFINAQSTNSDVLDYTWFVNNNKILAENDNSSILNLQFENNDNISLALKVIINNVSNLLQEAQGTFEISFSGSSRSSLFGL